MTLIPGVHSASLAAVTPISGAAGSLFVDVEGVVEHPDDRRRLCVNGAALAPTNEQLFDGATGPWLVWVMQPIGK